MCANTLAMSEVNTSNSTLTWQAAWGTPAPTALYLGMATLHFNPSSRDDNWNNQLVALTYDGYFAGTLLNSFHDRAYAAGIQRVISSQTLTANVQGDLGYRLGVITGYDESMTSIAKYTPILPFPQLTYDLHWQHIGIEFSWCLVTASAGLFYRF